MAESENPVFYPIKFVEGWIFMAADEEIYSAVFVLKVKLEGCTIMASIVPPPGIEPGPSGLQPDAHTTLKLRRNKSIYSIIL